MHPMPCMFHAPGRLIQDNPAFVKEVEKTGRKTLIIAGTLTSVCMAFPAVSAVREGYKVYCVVDASGNWSKIATDTTIARVAQAGAIPTDTFAIVAELMRTRTARKVLALLRSRRACLSGI